MACYSIPVKVSESKHRTAYAGRLWIVNIRQNQQPTQEIFTSIYGGLSHYQHPALIKNGSGVLGGIKEAEIEGQHV